MKSHVYSEILIAIAHGDQIERLDTMDGHWSGERVLKWTKISHAEALADISKSARGSLEYRIAPRTIMIGAAEVVRGERAAPADDTRYYYPVITGDTSSHDDSAYWGMTVFYGVVVDRSRLANGLLHLTKENAIAHAKALLSLTKYVD